MAAVQGHGAIMDLLITHGAKVNNKNNSGDCPLHYAAQYGRSLLLVKLLNVCCVCVYVCVCVWCLGGRVVSKTFFFSLPSLSTLPLCRLVLM